MSGTVRQTVPGSVPSPPPARRAGEAGEARGGAAMAMAAAAGEASGGGVSDADGFSETGSIASSSSARSGTSSARSRSRLLRSLVKDAGRAERSGLYARVARLRLVRWFNRIPLLYRALVILAIPLLALSLLSGVLAVDVVAAAGERDLVEDLAALSVAVSAVVHRLQLERGWGGAFLSPTCLPESPCAAATGATLAEMMAATDEAVGALNAQRAAKKDTEMQLGTLTWGVLDADGTQRRGWDQTMATLQGVSTLRQLVWGRAVHPDTVFDAYIDLIAHLSDSQMHMGDLVSNTAFLRQLLTFSHIVQCKERMGISRGIGATYWGAGFGTAQRQAFYQTVQAELSIYCSFFRAAASDELVDALDAAFASPSGLASMSAFALMAANDTAGMRTWGDLGDAADGGGGSTWGRSLMIANTTGFIDQTHAVEIDQGAVVSATSKLSINERDIVLVTVSVVIAIFSSTVLTFLLVMSVKATNRVLAREIERTKKTDEAIRKFIPTKFMHLLDITDPSKITIGQRSEMQLTVLFADLRGFTSLAERLSPDDAFEVLLMYTRTVAPVVARRGGFVDKWLGDGALCVFVDAEEAVFAAVEIQAEIKKVNIELASTAHLPDPQQEDPHMGARPRMRLSQPTADAEPNRASSMDGYSGTTTPAELVDMATARTASSSNDHVPRLSSTVLRQATLEADETKESDGGGGGVHFADERGDGLGGSYRTSDSQRTRSEHERIELMVGIGIHTGIAILGTVGDESRVDGTIIGDSVNVASRLEALCGHLGAEIIISESTLSKIRVPEGIAMRSLGPTKLVGRTMPLEIFEVIESNDPKLKRFKMDTDESFSRAVSLNHMGQTDEAAALLSSIRQSFPLLNDPVVDNQIHLVRTGRSASSKADPRETRSRSSDDARADTPRSAVYARQQGSPAAPAGGGGRVTLEPLPSRSSQPPSTGSVHSYKYLLDNVVEPNEGSSSSPQRRRSKHRR